MLGVKILVQSSPTKYLNEIKKPPV
jgi:hypothetical protein